MHVQCTYCASFFTFIFCEHIPKKDIFKDFINRWIGRAKQCCGFGSRFGQIQKNLPGCIWIVMDSTVLYLNTVQQSENLYSVPVLYQGCIYLSFISNYISL